jgi:tetratricopeptide (TPR) repeat protein
VRYVLEGSVRKVGDRVRITAQLIEAEIGGNLWADRFDGSLEDVFELQDKVAITVAGVIEPTLQAAETARSASRPTNDLTAYDLYLRAYAIIFTSARNMSQALALLRQAIAHDPNYGPALALAAICCLRLVNDDSSEDADTDRRSGVDFARQALEVARDDPGTLANAAFALACFGEDIDTMTALVDRALAFNLSSARGWFISSCLRLWVGQPDLAIEHAEEAQRLSPRSQTASPSYVVGSAHFISRRYNDAVPKLRLAIQEVPSFPTPYRYLAACYAHMGRLDEARETIARLAAITTAPRLNFPHPLRNPEHRELLLSGLRLAAGEAG